MEPGKSPEPPPCALSNSSVTVEQAAATPRWTRAQVARRLGKSISTVRRLEGVDLHPVRGPDGVNRFDPAEVEALARRTGAPGSASLAPGVLAARVFKRLDEKATLHDLVIELEQPPQVLRALYREWQLGFEDGEKQRRLREQAARGERELARITERQDSEGEQWLKNLQKQRAEEDRRDERERADRRAARSREGGGFGLF